MIIFGGKFLAESAYLKLPFWRGSGGKSQRLFENARKGNEGLKTKMKAQKAKMNAQKPKIEGPEGQNERPEGQK